MTLPILTAALAAAALLLAGGAQAQELVRVGSLKFAHHGAVAYTKEIAPKCGIRVEEKIFAEGFDVMQALSAGELDVGSTGSEAAIAGRAGGAPIFIVAGFAKGGARLVARRDQRIKSLKGLKGKKVGVSRGGIGEVLLMAGLLDAGISADSAPGKDVLLVYLPFADLHPELSSRKIDAMMLSEPQSSQAPGKGKGFGVDVLKPYDTPIGEPVRTVVMTEAFYHRKRALAEKFMRCFVEATRTFIDDAPLAEKYVREVVFKGQLSSADLRDAFANSTYAYDISAQHIQVTTDTMVRTGVGGIARAPRARDWVRTDLLETAKKSLGVK